MTWNSELKIEGYEQWIRNEQNAIRKGVFAKTPDPVVFGPDKLRYLDLDILDNPFFEIGENFYIGEYRRCDYPDMR